MKNWPFRLFRPDVIGYFAPVRMRIRAQKKSLYIQVTWRTASAARAGRIKRQGDPARNAPDRGTVDEGRLVELDRQRLHVVAQHEGAEAELEGDVDHHDPEVLVVEEAVVAEDRRQREGEVHPIERGDDDLRWEQVGGREQQQQGVTLNRQLKRDTAKAIIEARNRTSTTAGTTMTTVLKKYLGSSARSQAFS